MRFALLLVLAATSFALDANDIRITQRDPTNVANLLRDLHFPASDGLVVLEASSTQPKIGTFGTGFSWSGSVLNLSGIPESAVTGLDYDLDAKSDVGHTHVLADITDVTVTGAAIAAAANTGAVKTALGLATVASSGAYSDLTGKPSLATVATSGAYADLIGKPSLATVATTGVYSDLTGRPSLATVATSGAYADLTGKPSLATVATSGVYADLTGKPSLATVATSGSYTDLSNKPSIPGAASQSSASHSIGTSGWQVSTTRPAIVSYSVSIATSLSLSGGSAGYISLEIASDSGFTTNLQEVARFSNTQTGSLTIGLALNQTVGGVLVGLVPASYYARLKSTNVTATPTYTYIVGQETLF